MSYVKAEDVLPKHLVEEVQKYIDGQLLYIPRKKENSLSWGEKKGTKEELLKRNQEIIDYYKAGQTVEELSKLFFLSEKRIRGIIHEFESSKTYKIEGA